jgi:hypothetical protein
MRDALVATIISAGAGGAVHRLGDFVELWRREQWDESYADADGTGWLTSMLRSATDRHAGSDGDADAQWIAN